ncbi:dockerin type I domain-containing protein [Ruminiclostridium josui]|uniref:dockerin type I domain-containing protein n=1 Tax=Ruminiclostridium josui TaxID=1499 RepID=UPI0004677584|nr:dockerin type I domain-containing protein [Ruminiclostridium josui]
MKKFFIFLLLLTLLTTSLFGMRSVYADTVYERQEKVLVVLVQFTEPQLPRTGCDASYDGTAKGNDEYYSELFFGTGIDSQTGFPKMTVRNYFREVSCGKLDLQPAQENYGDNDGVVRVTLDYPYPDAEQFTNGSRMIDEVGTEAKDALMDALSELYNFVDFSAFDENNDGRIDKNELHIVTLIASGRDTPFLRACYIRTVNIANTNIRLFSGVSVCNSESSLYTISHELAHSMGALDLYNRTNAENINKDSIMHQTTGYLDPWHRMKLGFVNPQVVNASGSYTVNSTDPNNPGSYNVLKIPVSSSNAPPYYRDEYFLIENRQPVSFDSNTSRINGGIAIWHVKSANVGTPAILNLGDYRLEAADLNTYYDTDSFRPFTNKLYFAGDVIGDFIDRNLSPVSSIGKSTFGPNTLPCNSKRFDGSDSGVSITVSSQSSGSMVVNVEMLSSPQNFKATADEDGNTVLTWDPVPSATEYEVMIDDGTFFSVGTNTSYTCSNSNKHIYRVRAKFSSVTGLETQALNTNCLLYGDIDNDGSITESDYSLLSEYLLDTSITLSDPQLVVADVNEDGSIDVLDKTELRMYLNGSKTKFTAGTKKLITYGDVNGDGLVTRDDADAIKYFGDNITNPVHRVAANLMINKAGYYGTIDNEDYMFLNDYLNWDRYMFPSMY